ncbi:Conserved hypothetical protein [Yarrowia lipolytica]|nr:Hypothetical protein YALI2_E01548g [Yarrowia lipolytica]VBB78878.1 Conserved hypothetical protein [Yarrowia lipolytica]
MSTLTNETSRPPVVPRGSPPLKITCGPLLRYLGMRDKAADVWRGTIMICTEDMSSDLSTTPFLTITSTNGFQNTLEAKNILSEMGISFWRWSVEIPMTNEEQKLHYRINEEAAAASFFVPALEQSMNVVFHSCNGFSMGVDPSVFNGSLWTDVMKEHEKAHYHVMLGGGDQIYCDSVKQYTEHFKEWIEAEHGHKDRIKWTPEMRDELHRFYLFHYMAWFGAGFWRGPKGSTQQTNLPLAFASIPMINIFDDHDIIDGFGSYPEKTMTGPVFGGIGRVAYKYYMLFQNQTLVDIEGGARDNLTDDVEDPSWVLGAKTGPYIHNRSRSIYARLGKSIAFHGLDCRTERKIDQIITRETYQLNFQRIEKELAAAKGEIKHLLLMIGVPMAYPRLVWLERLLTSPLLAPIRYLSRRKVVAAGLVNEFDGRVEILDDLDDHWCAQRHKKERNALVERLFELAQKYSVRITILSGDVHLAGIGRFYTKSLNPTKHHKVSVPVINDHRNMLNVISSAIVNTPPPDTMADFLNKRNKVHHFDFKTDENMVSIFPCDVDGSHRNNKRLLPRRNWCSIIELDNLQKFDPKAARIGENRRPGPMGPDFKTSGDYTTHMGGGSKSQHAGKKVEHISSKPVEEELPIEALPSSLSLALRIEIDPSKPSGDTNPYEILIPELQLRPSSGLSSKLSSKA